MPTSKSIALFIALVLSFSACKRKKDASALAQDSTAQEKVTTVKKDSIIQETVIAEPKKTKKKQRLIDTTPGIQDVLLGADVTKLADRITYKDNFVGGSEETALYFIKLSREIAEGCRGNISTLRVSTFRDKIMEIRTRGWCSGLKEMFINKFGEPTQSMGQSHLWEGSGKSLILKATGQTYSGGKPDYEIIFRSEMIEKQFEKSRGTGNL